VSSIKPFKSLTARDITLQPSTVIQDWLHKLSFRRWRYYRPNWPNLSWLTRPNS